jgi:IG-like fold at C-terminal of FixG, putative oxidoreductase
LLGYAIAGLVGAMVAGFVVGRRVEVEANIVRAPGPPFVIAPDGRVTNALLLHVSNRSSAQAELELEVKLPPGLSVMVPPQSSLKAEETRTIPLVVSAPQGTHIDGELMVVEVKSGTTERELTAPLMGPGS